jgi:hypothetical protein
MEKMLQNSDLVCVISVVAKKNCVVVMLSASCPNSTDVHVFKPFFDLKNCPHHKMVARQKNPDAKKYTFHVVKLLSSS